MQTKKLKNSFIFKLHQKFFRHSQSSVNFICCLFSISLLFRKFSKSSNRQVLNWICWPSIPLLKFSQVKNALIYCTNKKLQHFLELVNATGRNSYIKHMCEPKSIINEFILILILLTYIKSIVVNWNLFFVVSSQFNSNSENCSLQVNTTLKVSLK